MGRKLERKKRKEKRRQREIKAMEKSLGINQPPKMCPKCGTLMNYKKPTKRRIGGVVGEGNMGSIYIVEPGSMSPSTLAQEKKIYICPKCEFQNIN